MISTEQIPQRQIWTGGGGARGGYWVSGKGEGDGEGDGEGNDDGFLRQLIFPDDKACMLTWVNSSSAGKKVHSKCEQEHNFSGSESKCLPVNLKLRCMVSLGMWWNPQSISAVALVLLGILKW